MTYERRVVVPAAAGPVAGQAFAFLVQGVCVPDFGKRFIEHGPDACVLLQAGVNMAPWIDAGHQYPCVTGGIRDALPGLEAVNPLSHVRVFGQRCAPELLGY